MKILIGLGGLFKTSMKHYQPCKPIRYWTHENPLALNSVIYIIYYVIVNIVYFSPIPLCDLGMKIPIGRGGLCKTSMRH